MIAVFLWLFVFSVLLGVGLESGQTLLPIGALFGFLFVMFGALATHTTPYSILGLTLRIASWSILAPLSGSTLGAAVIRHRDRLRLSDRTG